MRHVFLLLAALLPAAGLAAPRVVTDIPPVHSIVARVMQGIGEPSVLLPAGASEHSHALRPSDAAALQEADLVFWIGPGLGPWLAEPIAALATDATVVEIAGIAGLELLAFREGGALESEGHDGAGVDPHLWLDPVNAATIARAAAAALGATDRGNAAAYAANAAAFGDEMKTLQADIEARIAPVRGRRFIVFHDAYQYFEARFRIPAAGAIALGDASPPSAARVAEIRDRVRELGVVCVFAEPQFEPRLIATVTEGTAARTGTLDPLGAGLAAGPDLYGALLRNLADSLAGCLGGDA